MKCEDIGDNNSNNKQDKSSNNKKIKPRKPDNKDPSQNMPIASKSTKRKLDSQDASSPKPEKKITFAPQIQSMMHAFGDVPMTQADSAELIETIVLQQLHSALLQAAETAMARNLEVIMAEDLVFLMRKDSVKLSRLIHFIKIKDSNVPRLIANGGDLRDGGDLEVLEGEEESRQDQILGFLDELDPTGKLVYMFEGDIYDEVKFIRHRRAERQTRFMSPEQYQNYFKARTVTFSKKFKHQKFRDWIYEQLDLDMKPNDFALDVLHFMAFETVYQIVDLSLIIVQENGHFVQRMDTDLLPNSPEVSPSSSPGPSSSPKTKRFKAALDTNDQPISMRAITPNDIYEAMDRYFKETGALSLFSPTYNSTMGKLLLCC